MQESIKERPILFSAPMVRALLDGSKTQTRRVVKGMALDLLENAKFTPEYVADPDNSMCPYGKVGDRLWVRETCQAVQDGMTFGVNYPADNYTQWLFRDRDTDWLTMYDYRGASGAVIPSIHMRRWASRITLEITSVRVERLNDISESDAAAEGFDLPPAYGQGFKFRARHNFKFTWDSIYKNWDQNPWVWVVEFKVIK